MAGKQMVLFGAGMTGRGQVAQLAYEDGWGLTLVDRDEALVSALRRSGSYTVQLLSSNGSREVVVENFQVYHSEDSQEIAGAVGQADLLVTSVLEPNFPEVARTIAAALEPRLARPDPQPLNIIAAENMEQGSEKLGQLIQPLLPPEVQPAYSQTVGFPNSMISRVVPIAADPKWIVTEEYSEWTADQSGACGQPPALNGLEWVSNQTARLERKLFIHNTGHVICGFLGWLEGYRYIHEAAQDAEIMGRIQAAISESGLAISREHHFAPEDVKSYEDHLLGRLVISALADDIRRVIRHPIRKLGKQERLVGPLLLCEKHGLAHQGLNYGIAAVLLGGSLAYHSFPNDSQFERIRQAISQSGPVNALESLVDYQPSPIAAEEISSSFLLLKNLFEKP
jgi:mannitol-1-phosphate 5-dehydrogenase